ncbi:MAG: sigma 54-interacting transcriptional regulator [Myxococcota bacterium]
MGHGFEEDLETDVLAVAPRPLVDRIVVDVVAGRDRGRRARADGADEVSVGTAPGSGLALTDPTVSGHHCSLQRGPRGVRLRDLGSTNGTFLSGHRVVEADLEPGTRFVVGETTLELAVEAGPDDVSDEEHFEGLRGTSLAMRRIFATLPRIAASDVSVLLEGETGTGKTLLASGLHDASTRAGAPFVVLDCGAVASTLIESALFGHERGAFTGAHEARDGIFVAADGGTVFLDEIGELPLDLQPKLLRVLEEGCVTPLGATEERRVDCRIIAATHRDIRARVNDGSFRADLFYRLAVMRITVPPLRERPDDIELLARHFFAQLSPEQPEPPPAWIARWRAQRWTGNVRELRSAVERAILLGDSWGSSTISNAVDVRDVRHPFRVAKEAAVARFERRYLHVLIHAHGGNVSASARAAKMDRNHLRELLRRHQIDPKTARG